MRAAARPGTAVEEDSFGKKAAGVATATAGATTTAGAEYTPQTGQRRRRGRNIITTNGGRLAKDRQDHRPWPVVLAVHRPLAAGAIEFWGKRPCAIGPIGPRPETDRLEGK